MRTPIQKWRALTQAAFFVLFILAPPLDMFRYDLTQGHFILLGFDWTLRLDSLHHDDSYAAAYRVLFFGLLPILLAALSFIYVAWRWGRLYCGWLCPHYSVVEIINKLMIRASGKPAIWEKKKLPQRQSDFSVLKPDSRFWLPTILAVVLFAFIWAVSLLTYLLPPFEIYHNLINAELTRNQSLFISIATILFCVEFLLARHLFCRFGCAVGLFQSLAWMANRKAMVITFDRSRGRACRDCNNACDNACPMRLQPRTIKRKMFTCTQCAECISACNRVQQIQPYDGGRGLLQWVQDEAAAVISEPPASSSSSQQAVRRKVITDNYSTDSPAVDRQLLNKQ